MTRLGVSSSVSFEQRGSVLRLGAHVVLTKNVVVLSSHELSASELTQLTVLFLSAASLSDAVFL